MNRARILAYITGTVDQERNHQGKNNVVLFPQVQVTWIQDDKNVLPVK